MKTPTNLMALCLLSFAGLTVASTKEARAESITVCEFQPVPAGFVITSWVATKDCGITTNLHPFNAKTIDRYEGKQTLAICSSRFRPQATPPGYVVISKARTRCDDSTLENTLTITTYDGKPTMDICLNQPLPPGYVITARLKTAACGYTTGTTPNTSRIVQLKSG